MSSQFIRFIRNSGIIGTLELDYSKGAYPWFGHIIGRYDRNHSDIIVQDIEYLNIRYVGTSAEEAEAEFENAVIRASIYLNRPLANNPNVPYKINELSSNDSYMNYLRAQKTITEDQYRAIVKHYSPKKEPDPYDDPYYM